MCASMCRAVERVFLARVSRDSRLLCEYATIIIRMCVGRGDLWENFLWPGIFVSNGAGGKRERYTNSARWAMRCRDFIWIALCLYYFDGVLWLVVLITKHLINFELQKILVLNYS